MPNFTDYVVLTTTTVTVIAMETGKKVLQETFEVSATGSANTVGDQQPLHDVIGAVIGETTEKAAAHAKAMQSNENRRRRYQGEGTDGHPA